MRYEAQEVRAFGLMLADMVQRLDISFEGEACLCRMWGRLSRMGAC